MRFVFWASALLAMACTLAAVGPAPAPPGPPTQADKEEYQTFVKTMVTVESLTDCIAKMDGLIAGGEESGGVVSATTVNGLAMTFQVAQSDQAILYYFMISREGKPFELNEAIKIASLFCDRAGLPHAIDVRYGERPVYTAQWLIKPKEWKKLQKAMLAQRAKNREVKHPQQAFINAVDAEMRARARR